MNCTCWKVKVQEEDLQLIEKIQEAKAEELRRVSETEAAKLAASDELRTAVTRLELRVYALAFTPEQRNELLKCIVEIRTAMGDKSDW